MGVLLAVSPCDSGLVAYWKMDENIGSVVGDSAGNHNLQLVGAPMWVPGRVNSALSFDNRGSMAVDYNLAPSTLGLTDQLTVSAWVYLTNYNSEGSPAFFSLFDGYWAYNLYPFGLGYSPSFGLSGPSGTSVTNKIFFSFCNTSADWSRNYCYDAVSNNLASDYFNGWHMITGVKTPTSIILYIDGQPQSWQPAVLGSIYQSASSGFAIGNIPAAIQGGGGSDYTPKGKVDEVAIWNRALSQSEIQQMYQNGLQGKGYCEAGAGAPPTMCGDEVVEGDEQCDDGNTASGDGCSSTCQIETVSCEQTISNSFKMYNDITDCTNYGVYIQQNNIVLDCNGHRISGTPSSSSGIAAYRNNVTLKNCVIEGFNYGINMYFRGTIYNNQVINCTVTNSRTHGLFLRVADSNFSNNRICGSGTFDIYNVVTTNNIGINNTCDSAYQWNDQGVGISGCTVPCMADDTPPETTIIPSSQVAKMYGKYIADVPVTISATDPVGIRYINYSINGVWSQVSASSTTFILDSTAKIQAVAVDRAGNVGQQVNLTILIDKRYANTTVYDNTGGTVRNEVAEATIEIPAGALPESSVEITIEPSQQSFVPTFGMTPIEGKQPYDFGPAGIQFESPVTVSMPGDCTNFDESQFYYQCIGEYVNGQWECVVQCDWDNDPPSADRPSCIDINDGRVATWNWNTCILTTQTMHFSTYAVLIFTNDTGAMTACSSGSITEEGIHTLLYSAKDMAGHVTATLTKIFSVDLFPPETSIDISGVMGNGGWYISPVSVTLSAVDTVLGSGVDKTYHMFAHQSAIVYDGPFEIDRQGSFGLYYYSKDVAGWTESIKSVQLKIDTIAPVTVASMEGVLSSTGWFLSDVTVTLSATDAMPGSGVISTEYSIDGGAWVPYTGPFVISKGGNPITYLRMRSTDVAGNVEEAKLELVKIDTIPPEPTVITDPGIWSNDGSVTIVWQPVVDEQSGTDYYKIYRCSMYNTLETCTPTELLATSETTGYTDTGLQDATAYFYVVTTVDKAGNEAGISNIVDIIIDMSPPFPPELYPISSNGFLNKQSADLSWSEAKDEGVLASGLNRYNLFESDTPFAIPLPPAPSKALLTIRPAGTQTYTHSGLQDAVTYYYQISATDNAGNEGDLSNEQHVTIDLVAPVSTATIVSGTPGTQGWYTSGVYVQIDSTDAVSQVMRIEYRTSGAVDTPLMEYNGPISISADGITTVYYRAIDNAGNVESEKSIVVKIDTAPPVTTDNAPSGWQNNDVTVTLSPTDATSGVFATRTCQYIHPDTNCIPSGDSRSVLVSAEGVSTILYYSVDNAGNVEDTKSAAVWLDKTAPITTTSVTGTVEPMPYNDWFMDSATVSLSALDPLPASEQSSGVALILYCVDKVNACNPSTPGITLQVTAQGMNYVRFYSTDNAGNAEAVKSITVKIDRDTDNDGVYDNFDACKGTPGLPAYQGCPVGDSNFVELHIIDQAKLGMCPGGTGSCKLPIEGAMVRVFNRNDPAFQARWTKNPKGTDYPAVYEAGIGWIGANTPIYAARNASCITDVAGRCTAGETGIGDYLVIVKYYDPTTNKTVYVGRPKSPEDFIDTNKDGRPDLAYKDFQIIRVYEKGGAISYKAGEKTVVTGSLLEIIYPQYTIWENTREIYPFIFSSDSEWAVDVCLYVPEGYQVVEGNCTQVFVAGETKEMLFTVVETGSPEPNMMASLNVTGPHRNAVIDIEIPGERKRPSNVILVALVVITAVIIAMAIAMILLQGGKGRGYRSKR
ncbi:MAG: LamG-like jellyroll fold domain-containing protein [Candidatus Micrarchaeia archaeon]